MADSQQIEYRTSKKAPMNDRSILSIPVSHARTKPKPNSWRGVGVLCLWVSVACAAVPARDAIPATTNICPQGTHNYGDGMVASLLSSEATEALVQAHARALQGAGQNRSSFLADQPWRPHVSVIYGVTNDRAGRAYQAMQSFLKSGKSVSACFGELQYWDDETGGKTTLVVDVIEPSRLLNSLHDALAEAAHISSRFAYHPHVTLLYLQEHGRLNVEAEAAVLASLRGVCWPSGSFYLTDPCGQELYRAHVPDGQPLPARD